MLPIPEMDLGQLAQECWTILRHARPGVAVFDADGTLWAPDIANRLWRRITAERILAKPGADAVFSAMKQAGLPSTGDPHTDADALFSAYYAGRVNEEIVVRIMINGVAGLSTSAVDALVGRALHQDKPAWADEEHAGMADFVRELARLGMRIVLCSGSPLWAVEAGARALGLPVEKTLAGDVVREGEWLTTEIVEPLTFRWGKGAAYDLAIRERPLFAFGDGESDIPLLQRATRLAVAVNPRPSLRKALPEFGTRARILRFDRTKAGRPISAPEQDESTE